MHFGPFIKGATRDRGAWIITCWGGDIVRLAQSGHDLSDGCSDSIAASSLLRDVGATLMDINLEVGSLALNVAFSTGTRLRVQIDPAFDGDSWLVSLPNRSTLSFGPKRQWSLEWDASTAP
jgi:hypothetical protein